MPSVGDLEFDGITGGVWHPISEAQKDAFAGAAQAFRMKEAPPTAQGECEVWIDITEENAGDLVAQASRYVGGQVDVAYGFGTVSGVTVADVNGQWLAKDGTINGGVLTIRFTFDSAATDDGNSGDSSVATVQTATEFGTWNTQASLECFESSEGLATYAGESSADAYGVAPLDIVGQWVRILDDDDDPVWWGTVTSRNISGASDESKATIHYGFTGLAGAFNQIAITEWYEWKDDATTWLTGAASLGNPGVVLPFNGILTGDASANPKTLPSAATATVHARGMPGTQFTATQAATTLLKIAKEIWPAGPTWVLGGQLARLDDLKTTINCRGMTLLEALAAVISVESGHTFRFEVTGETAITIVVRYLDEDNAGADDVDMTETEISSFDLASDETNTNDRVYVAGPQPWIMSSFSYLTDNSGEFRTGWDPGTPQTNWIARIGAEKDAPDTAMVYRRFILSPTWVGGREGSHARVLQFLRFADALGQEDGNLVAGGSWPNARTGVKFQRMLPIGKGRDWSQSYAKVNRGDELEGPLVFAVKDSTYVPLHAKMHVAIGDDQASVVLGKDFQDAVLIRNYLAEGYRLVFTLSWIHPLPWRTSWSRNQGIPATGPRDLFRSILVERNEEALQRIHMDSGTIVGLDSSGAPLLGDANAGDFALVGSGRVDGNASNGLRTVLDNLVKIHGAPVGSATWTRLGLDDAGLAPGDLLLDAIVPINSTTDHTETVNGIVSRRTRNFTRGSTSITWQASRLIGSAPLMTRAKALPSVLRPAAIQKYGGGL